VRRRFVVTREARSDLREILFEIAEASPEAAERLLAVFFSLRINEPTTEELKLKDDSNDVVICNQE
jgi:hypothetical protein